MHRLIIRSIVAVLLVVTIVVFAGPAAAQTVGYSPPVDAPVSDPFRPPSTPYGPGNRGLEYATPPGTTIRAAASGSVVFAGVVAGRRWITIRHDDGVRTTYGPLAEFAVASGALVERGAPIGVTAGPVTFTARVGDAYIDPDTLFDAGPPRVHLVPEPLDEPPAIGASRTRTTERDALRSALDWELRHLASIGPTILELTPAPFVRDSIDALRTWRSAECTDPSVAPAPPPGRRLAVLVGGLGSSSESAAIADVDTAALGYRAGDVVRFSYAGGRVPTDAAVASEFDGLAATGYAAKDTTGDIEAAGRRLAAALEAVSSAAAPGVTIDVIAHSQGGIVARVALDELARRDPAALERVRLAITLGTPHGGADLAGLVRAADANPLDPVLLEAVQQVSALPIAPDDEAVRQLAPGSDLLARLAYAPPPPGVSFVSIAARGDVVVPSPRSHLGGATNVVIPLDGPTAHDQLPGSAAAAREMRLAIAGLPPSCRSAADAVLDAISGDLIRNIEHLATVANGG